MACHGIAAALRSQDDRTYLETFYTVHTHLSFQCPLQVPASHVRSLRSLLQSSPNFFSSTNSRSSSSNNNPAPNVFSWWPQGGLWSQARAASAPALPDIKTIQEVGLEEACVCWAPDECTCGVLQCPYVPPAGAAQADKAWSGLVPQLTLSAPMNQGIPAPRLRCVVLLSYCIIVCVSR